MPPHAVVGLACVVACVVLAAAACTGTRDLATRGEKYGKFLKGDEKEVGRFKLNGRRLSGVRAWGADKWIKIYNGYVTEDFRQLQYQLQYSFLAGGCRDPAGNPCTDVERYRRMP